MDDEKNPEKRTNVIAAVGIGFVCLVIGVPLWWKTTEVYRVSLPYSDIDTLAERGIEYSVDINVVSFVETLSQQELVAISKHLMKDLERNSDFDVVPHYKIAVREATVEERKKLETSSSAKDFEKTLSSRDNKYTVIILPEKNPFSITMPTMGVERCVFFTYKDKDLENLANSIVSAVQTTLVREATVTKGYNTAKGERNIQADKESMRSVRYHPGYDITLTLVSPRPDIMDVQWDIESAEEGYFKPFVQKLEKYARINLKSQSWTFVEKSKKGLIPVTLTGYLDIDPCHAAYNPQYNRIQRSKGYKHWNQSFLVLFFTKLQSKPRKDKKGFYFTTNDLPLMINPLESKLGSPASTQPDLNFLVYVPTKEQYPLYIKDDKGEYISSNSFLSPQWGGVLIYDVQPPSKNDTLPIRPHLKMKHVMEVFITQIRLLLNLHSQVTENVQTLPPDNSAITEWELDSWLRSRCVENLAMSSASLKSLSQLLGKISNIVINDDIGQQVKLSVEAMKKSFQQLQDGDLIEAFLSSRTAAIASEKAFFDPSLLELLYFPEDQKFAIYIPLFLPISFPVIASLFQAFKWYKKQTKQKQE